MNTLDARSLLQSLVDQTLQPSTSVDVGSQFEGIRLELADQRQRAREIVDELRGLESFGEVAASYATELVEHRARLVSIGLVADETGDAQCPVCGSDIHGPDAPDDHSAVTSELSGVSRRLELAARDRPRIERARSDLLSERDTALQRIAELNEIMSALADTNDLAGRERQRVNIQSYVRGKIAEYLSSVVNIESTELDALQLRVAQLRAAVEELEASLDPALCVSAEMSPRSRRRSTLSIHTTAFV
jgi:uncharacterized Zn finger protein (UPF0148 family)